MKDYALIDRVGPPPTCMPYRWQKAFYDTAVANGLIPGSYVNQMGYKPRKPIDPESVKLSLKV